ncbi:MAG: hypothetical protein AABM29_03810 [Actinomycetota bacterium]
MEASRPQPALLEGLSRFLIRHEPCGAGFDVAHPAGLGGGRVSITCRGCGARHDYATATIEVEREVRIEPGSPAPPADRPVPAAIATGGAVHGEAADAGIAAGANVEPAAGAVADPQTTAAPERAWHSHTDRLEPPAGMPQPPSGPGPVPPIGMPPRARMHRWWQSPNATVALIAVAVLALALAGLRIGTADEQTASDETAAPSPPAPAIGSGAPAGALNSAGQAGSGDEGTAADNGAAGSEEAGGSEGAAAGEGAAKPAAPRTTLLRTQRYSVRLPRGWSQRSAGGGLLLQPRSATSAAQVQIFYQQAPTLTLASMVERTAELLRSRNPGAALTATRRLRLGRGEGFELGARSPGHSETAVGIARGSYRYLLLRRIAHDAPLRARREAAAIERSLSIR